MSSVHIQLLCRDLDLRAREDYLLIAPALCVAVISSNKTVIIALARHIKHLFQQQKVESVILSR